MYNSDEALHLFRESLSGLCEELKLNDLNDKKVSVILKTKELDFEAWFDTERQLFGFEMLQGGEKTYLTIEDLASNLSVYIDINTNFIPSAKLIAKEIEASIEPKMNLIFDSFRGSSSGGYTAIFCIVGDKEHQLRVVNSDDLFIANFVEIEESNAGYKNIWSRAYSITEERYVVRHLRLEDFEYELFEKYEDADWVTIEILNDDKFKYTFDDGNSILLRVYIEDNAYCYTIENVYSNGNALVGLDLSSLLDLDLLDLNSFEMALADCIENYNETIISDDEDDIEDTSVESDKSIEEEEVEEEKQRENSLLRVEIKDTESIFIKKLSRSDNIQGIRIVDDGTPYDISLSKALELGIPISRIASIEELKIIRGMYMTDSEMENRVFAVDISDDEVKCKELVNKLFS